MPHSRPHVQKNVQTTVQKHVRGVATFALPGGKQGHPLLATEDSGKSALSGPGPWVVTFQQFQATEAYFGNVAARPGATAMRRGSGKPRLV